MVGWSLCNQRFREVADLISALRSLAIICYISLVILVERMSRAIFLSHAREVDI